VEGGTVLPLDDGGEIFEVGFVDILGDRIAAVGPMSDRPATLPRRVIDAAGGVVLPGLVDAHTHLFQVAARGLGDGLRLAEWLRTHMVPLALALRRTEMVALTELAALHALRSGIVTCEPFADADRVHQLNQALEARNIYPTVRYCSGVGGLRVSIHYYTSRDDIDALLAALDEILKTDDGYARHIF